MLAMGLMSGLHQAGLRVPEDISVVGMDGLSIAAFCNPSLTSVAMPLTEMADAMVQRAVERSRDPQLPAVNLVFQPTLVPRHSVARPGADKRA
jgi:DNA-binding LacI/PurR family transcriptional regulator